MTGIKIFIAFVHYGGNRKLTLKLHFSVILALQLSQLGKRKKVNLSAFHTFVFVLVWFYSFPLLFCVWNGLRLVIVALSGLFSYLFFFIKTPLNAQADNIQ